MGILTNLLMLPVSGPLRGAVWIAQKLAEQAEHELYDEGAIRGQLQELEMRFDIGEMSEEEYIAAEESLLARMREIREYRAAKS